jgi:hypothetical protein
MLRIHDGIRIPVPLHRLWVIAFVAGTTWFVTITALLATWLARGMPRYPRQSNPYVAYVYFLPTYLNRWG